MASEWAGEWHLLLELEDMLYEEEVEPLVGQVDAKLRERVRLPLRVEVLKAKDVEHGDAVGDALAAGGGKGVVDTLDAPVKGERVQVHA